VQEGQLPISQKTPVRQGCQILREGESNGTTLGNSKQCCNSNQPLIQFPSGRHHLFRKKGRRLGWPTWPKIRFKSHAQSQWKFRFRALNRHSIRFKPPPGSCKLSRDTYRVRTLNRRRVIRFRTRHRSKSTACKKQQSLLRSKKVASKDLLCEGTFRVRMLNRCGSAIVASSMPHFQTHPVHADPRNIQAVTLHPYQYVSVQIIAKCREGMFRNIYDQVNAVMNNELSNAPSHSAGAQNQVQSQVVRTSKCDGARGLAHGQQPQPAQTALHTYVQSPLKHGSPPHGNKRSLARRAGEALKWRNRSHTISRHAQWTRQYNGVRTRIGKSSTRNSRPLVNGKKELVQTPICMKNSRSCS